MYFHQAQKQPAPPAKTRIALRKAVCLGGLGGLALLGSVLPAEAYHVLLSPKAQQHLIALPHAKRAISLELEGAALSQALEALALQGGVSIVQQEQWLLPVTLSFKNVPLQQALETLAQLYNLQYQLDKNVLLVHRRGGPSSLAHTPYVVQLEHAQASLIATYLQQSLGNGLGNPLGTAGAGLPPTTAALTGQEGMVIQPVEQQNALLIDTSPERFEQMCALLTQLDVPRRQQRWQLSHLNAVDAAQQLNALFNTPVGASLQGGAGIGAGTGGAGLGAGGSAPPVPVPAPAGTSAGGGAGVAGGGVGAALGTGGMMLQAVQVQEGTGANALSQTGNGGKQYTVRSQTAVLQAYQPDYNGLVVLPDDRTNTLTIYGTPTQLKQVAAWLQLKDVATQQVTIEVQIIEVSQTGFETLLPTISGQLGKNSRTTLSFNPATGSRAEFQKAYGSPVPATGDLAVSLNALQQKGKMKVISNPTIIASHNEESVINVVEEVVQGFQTVTSGNGQPVARIPNIVNAGIMLNILPKIGSNGDVSLRVNPVVSWPQPNTIGSNITLISRRELISEQVIIPQGHSFVLAGLSQQISSSIADKLPILGDLPILGALARGSSANKRKTELLIILTPHIERVGTVYK
ncbi:MAG: secretin N-terminal domain-containing protein [Vampirovibrionales bacterium]